MAYSPRDILITGLKNAYALESHAADVTENQASRLGDYPELQRRVQQHHEETLRQRDRLGECLSQLGESPSTLKDSVLRLVGNLQNMFHATADDEVLKGTFASVSLEHYEIAAYKSLIAMAEACNDLSVANVCRQNLREEEAMAEFLDRNIEQVTRARPGEPVRGDVRLSGRRKTERVAGATLRPHPPVAAPTALRDAIRA
jgi:ferritin-like metal-binding protein YciE